MRLQDLQKDLHQVLEGKKKKPSKGVQASAVAIGAAIGTTAGLLLAPHSGKETRAKIKQKAQTEMDKTKHKMHETKEDVGDKAEAVKDAATEGAKSVKSASKQAVKDTKRAAKTPPDNNDPLGRI